MTVRSLAAGRGRGVAVQLEAQGFALLVCHDRELEIHRRDTVERHDGIGDPGLDLVAQRTAGDGQRDRDAGDVAVDDCSPHHVEVDDASMQLWIFDGPQGLDEV